MPSRNHFNHTHVPVINIEDCLLDEEFDIFDVTPHFLKATEIDADAEWDDELELI